MFLLLWRLKMSQSPKEAAQDLQDALEFGRCPVCEGIQCEGLDGCCTCCARCGNSEELCTCCPDCWEDQSCCICSAAIQKKWSSVIYCWACPRDEHNLGNVHQVGEPCPLCCCKCKELKQDCICCKKCRTTPCICCTGCGNLRIKCKCWGAKILLHFMRRAAYYHKNQQELREQFFHRNTAALITVDSDDL